MERSTQRLWPIALILFLSLAVLGVAGAEAGDVIDGGRGDAPATVSAPPQTPHGLARIAVALNGIFRRPEERRVTDPWTLMTVVVTSRDAISKVLVTLNGIELPVKHERRPNGSVVVTAPVMLHQGANPLVVSTLAPNGDVQRDESTLIFDSRR